MMLCSALLAAVAAAAFGMEVVVADAPVVVESVVTNQVVVFAMELVGVPFPFPFVKAVVVVVVAAAPFPYLAVAGILVGPSVAAVGGVAEASLIHAYCITVDYARTIVVRKGLESDLLELEKINRKGGKCKSVSALV